MCSNFQPILQKSVKKKKRERENHIPLPSKENFKKIYTTVLLLLENTVQHQLPSLLLSLFGLHEIHMGPTIILNLALKTHSLVLLASVFCSNCQFHRTQMNSETSFPPVNRDIWCELRVPAGWLSDLLRLQWLPVLQAAILHAFGENRDEANRRVHDFLPPGLLRHTLPREKHMHK